MQKKKKGFFLNLKPIRSFWEGGVHIIYILTFLTACLKGAGAETDCLLQTLNIMQANESEAETSRQNK